MEAIWSTALLITSILFTLTVSCQYIHIPTSSRYGIEGQPLLLFVETHFTLDKVEMQGTWSHTWPSGTSTPLVTFTKDSTITDMMYRHRLRFREPLSLLIHNLTQDDEGDYHLKLNIEFHNQTGLVIKQERTVHVTVDVPLSTPVVEKSPSHAVIEDMANVTWRCSVERGTRVKFHWMKGNFRLGPAERYHLSPDNSTLVISPVKRTDRGMYQCVVSNPVSPGQRSAAAELTIYYGPYDLAVNSAHGLRTGEVFTINPGELVYFECQADSNPPNRYVWISKSNNGSQVIGEGPRLEMLSYKLAQAEEYVCRAFNNVTQKQDEAHFTLVVASLGGGADKHTMGSSSVSPLAIVTVCSLLIIGSMLLLLLRKNCHAKRMIMSIYNRPLSEEKTPHRLGHEDATDDFGIYEFISIPGKIESAQVSCRSLARLESVQDMHTTIYDVIRHVPETPSQSLLK